MRKLTIEQIRTRGLEKGFTLLSDTYTNAKTKLQWKCQQDHTIEIIFNSIDQDHGCSECYGTKKLTIEEVRAIGLKRGFTLLSDTYINNSTKLQWQCQNGHITQKSSSNIGRGCSICYGNKKLTIEEVRSRGLKKGFVLLSDTYKNCMTKLKWQCKNIHSFEMNFNNIDQSHGCLICSQKYDKAQSELYQYVLGMYPDAEYNRTKILNNPRLQLDVYIPSIKKAIELDGEYWHSKPKAIERDARKDKECQEAGIQLLRLGYMEHWYNKQESGKSMILNHLLA